MIIPLKKYDNVYYTYDYDDIKEVHFKYDSDSKYTDKCSNVMAADTENTGAYNDNGKAIPFDSKRYKMDEVYRAILEKLDACACMYMWQFGIDDEDRIIVYLGRTYDDFKSFHNKLTLEIKRQARFGHDINDYEYEIEQVQHSKRHVEAFVYFHNLAFDFVAFSNIFGDQFGKITHRKFKQKDEDGTYLRDEDGEYLTKSKTFANTFARNTRKPMKTAVNNDNFKLNIKDSYVLVSKSLSEWGNDEDLPVQKVKVSQDYYYEIRTPLTPLSDDEIEYAVIDIVTMIYGLRKYVERFGALWKIPLTSTSIVRQLTRKTLQCYDPEWQEQQLECQNSYSYEFYRNVLRQLYTGGWTHANATYVKRVLKADKDNPIICHDFASSYPYQMCCNDHLPVSAFHAVPKKQFDDIKDNPLKNTPIVWFGKFRFKELKSKLENTFFSFSKCVSVCGQTKIPDKMKKELIDNGDLLLDNGRVDYATDMECYLSDYEYNIFFNAYDWTEIECTELYVAQAGRMSPAFIKMILDLYHDKTKLKTKNPSQYRASKSNINGAYGMICTAVLSAVISFEDNKWHSDETEETMHELYDNLIENTKSEKMIAQYPIGIYICKAAMYALWQFIIKFDSRVVYCDTDSLKGFLTADDLKVIEDYNKKVKEEQDALAKELHIDPEMFAPTDDDGVPHRLGIFDREHDVNIEMAVLGAKRYFCKWHGYNKKKKVHEVQRECTVAGLPKKAGWKHFKSARQFIDPDNSFLDCLQSMKKMSAYNDDQPDIEWTDKYGNVYVSTERRTCAILPTTFDVSLSSDFEKYVKMIHSTRPCHYFKDDVPEALLFE